MSTKTVLVGDLVDEYSIRAKNFGDHSSFEFLGVSNEDGITKSKNASKDKVEDYKIIEQGCFAYNPYRINVGSIAYLDEDIKGFISPAYVVFKTKPKSIIPELLFKFLKSKEGLRQIKLYARGTVRQALRFEDLCKIELTIPHYDEQVKLFEKISLTENETIKLNNETDFQLRILTQLRQAFLCEAMQGKLVQQDKKDEPASELLKRIKAEKEKLIAEGKIKKQKPLPEIKPEEIPYEIPESWVWCRLGEILNNINNGISSGVHNINGDGTPHLRPMNIDMQGDINLSFTKYIHSKSEIFLKKDDIFFNNTNSKELVGKTTFIEENTKWLYSNHMTRISLISGLNVKFITKFFNYLFSISYFTSKCRKYINQASIGIDFLKNEMIIPLPPLAEQQRIVTKLEQLMQLCSELEKNINQSKEETNLLLQTVLREALEEN